MPTMLRAWSCTTILVVQLKMPVIFFFCIYACFWQFWFLKKSKYAFTWTGIHSKFFLFCPHFVFGGTISTFVIFVLQQVSPAFGQVACFDFSHHGGRPIVFTTNCDSALEAVLICFGVSKHWSDLTHVCPSNSEHSHFSSAMISFNVSSHCDVSSKSSPVGVLPEIK